MWADRPWDGGGIVQPVLKTDSCQWGGASLSLSALEGQCPGRGSEMLFGKLELTSDLL